MSSTCPYCRETVEESEGMACPECKTPHHHDCWDENKGCTVFGCIKAPADEQKIAVNSAEVLPPPLPRASAYAPPGRSPSDSAPGVNADVAYLVARDGVQTGPYNEPTLLARLNAGLCLPTDLAWSMGMDGWKPLSEIFPTALSMAGAYPQSVPQPRYAAPQPAYAVPQPGYTASQPRYAVPLGAMDPMGDRLRFGRLAYIGSVFGFSFVMGMMMALVKDMEPVLILLLYAGVFTMLVLRIRDVGHSGFLVLIALIPLAGIYIGYLAIAAPRGYAITKQADTGMKVFHWCLLGILILVVVGLVINGVAGR